MVGGGMMSKAYYSECPCKDCKLRSIGCHATCIPYKEWQNNSVEVKHPFYPQKKKRKTNKKN